ncbi:hypothetical protein ACX8XN_08270 [Calditrichota bacterium GD2]
MYVSSIPKSIPLPKEVPDLLMDEVSSYVHESEWRVKYAIISENSIEATVKFHSPTYTKKEVNYLSTSELAISTAQVAHILVEWIVNSENFKFKHILSVDRLHFMRKNHFIYFADWKVKFFKKHPAEDYRLWIKLERILCYKNTIVAEFFFGVDGFLKGEFLAAIPEINDCMKE